MFRILLACLTFLQSFIWLLPLFFFTSRYLSITLIVLAGIPFTLGLGVVLSRHKVYLILTLLYGFSAFLLYGFFGVLFTDPDDMIVGHPYWTTNRQLLVFQSLLSMIICVPCILLSRNNRIRPKD
jgi:hypothetical protein